MNIQRLVLVLALFLASADRANAKEISQEVAELRQLLEEMRETYESRITKLESRLEVAESSLSRANRDASEAMEISEQTAIMATTGATSANAFNPAISAVLVAGYGRVGTGWEQIPGFISGGEPGPGNSGISLGETELNFNANIDPRFYGNITVALEDEDGETAIGLEEAWVQTTGLSNGLTLLAGRYFSGIGYFNKFHGHANDFSDRPLPYQALLGGQYVPDGLQLRWIAPTPLFLEFGTELNFGSNFPTSGNHRSSPDAWSVFTNVGGDFGNSHSWQAGLSYLAADVAGRGGSDTGEPETDIFNGDSDLFGLNFVWKWAPDGNATLRNFKLQGEYFSRNEKGAFAGLPYDGDQRGWYVQGVWQFMQGWRVGYRHDVVAADNGAAFAGTVLADPGRNSSRNSVMIDWSPSEFSRLRMQWIDDQVYSASDDQLFLQYIMSIGAHGGHQF